MTSLGLLANLNPSQNAAVSSFADTLAILAGPGSGKTHTLTSRTAWLLAQGLQPWNVIVATFTVKAAREMKERIGKLIGNGLESKLILGTFHSISRRYLARYGHMIDLPKDFGIADTADSLAILKRIVKRNSFNIDPKVARSRISGKKSRTSEEYASQKKEKSVEAQEFEVCYAEYEESLKRSNLLDYDDLLLRCVDLLRRHPSCVSNVEAVLIDEFQDTNLVQFDLMRLFAAERKRITIVGDPDQSIYGFRAAETKNYKRMIHQYPDTVTIALEENYRSSGAILFTALNVIEQDTSRVAKSLLPTHTVGTRPVLRKLGNAHKEAEWIISEIQRCKGLAGDLLDMNDIAILLRSSALSRLIESALGKAGIAYRMVGGLRFYDRVEVKTILDYLRIINQPDNNDALARIVNNPSRRIGETTIKGLMEEADRSKITLWTLILGFVQGKRSAKTKLPAQTEKGLRSFVDIILTARNKMQDVEHPLNAVEIIDFVLKKTNYETWLEEHHNDITKARWANVEELKTQASDFQDMISTGYEDESLPMIDGIKQDDESASLSRFLATVALASEVKNEDDDSAPVAQVTISTIHAAKGLEWPIVFIPAAYQGSIPHSRSEDTNEERRLLYVAMTRAKALLYMSYPVKNSTGEQTTLSPFLSTPSVGRLLEEKGPSLRSSAIQSISQILRRPPPSLESISKSSEHLRSDEDNIFPTGAEDEDIEAESRWPANNSNPTFTMGQRPTKRQRVELGRSTSNVEDSTTNWRRTYTTTMDQTITCSSNVTFGSARSHLQVLSAQSVNCSIEKERPAPPQDATQMKPSTKHNPKLPNGQGTLFTFLGKSEPPPSLPLPHSFTLPTNAPLFNPNTHHEINAPRPPASSFSHTLPTTLSPTFTTHRLPTLPPSKSLPAQHPPHSGQKHNAYIFLSSSPSRPPPKAPEPFNSSPPRPPPRPPAFTSNPTILPLIRPATVLQRPAAIATQKPATTTQRPVTGVQCKEEPKPVQRPATSMHTTTMQSVGSGGKKTLGVKRSMNGWPPQRGRAYVPPTIRKS